MCGGEELNMIYTAQYESPVGKILLAAKEQKLIGLWWEGQKYFLAGLREKMEKAVDFPILVKTKRWLDAYFAGRKPKIEELEVELMGTDFRKAVWKILMKIPYGEVVTYQDIAKEFAKQEERKNMSAQAVGGAVGHNPISIIIPCHRVIGSDGSLTGYAGGIDKKAYLLKHEKVKKRMAL